MRSDRPEDDYVLDAALSRVDPDADIAEHCGVTYEDMHRDPDAAMATILDRYHAVAARVIKSCSSSAPRTPMSARPTSSR